MTTTPITLEVGKTYVDRLGNKHAITGQNGGFFFSVGRCWLSNGFYRGRAINHDLDLIANHSDAWEFCVKPEAVVWWFAGEDNMFNERDEAAGFARDAGHTNIVRLELDAATHNIISCTLESV